MQLKGKVVAKPIENPRILQKVIWKSAGKTYIAHIQDIKQQEEHDIIYVPKPNVANEYLFGFVADFKELFIEEPADMCVKSASQGTITHIYHPLIESDWERAIFKGYLEGGEQVEFFTDVVTGNDEAVAILLGNHTTVTGELVTKEELWAIYNSLDRPYGLDNIWGWMEKSGYVIVRKNKD